jgi:pentatricopeptide repeat protein
MIGACAENGEYDAALDCFDRMLHRGVRPVDVTYTSLLCACNRLGLVDDGCCHFERMVSDHCITPTVDHYNCMIDLMGRLGCLREARDISLTMPTIPSLVAWMSLLSHCRMHGYLDLASECYENVVVLDRSHASSYELMSRLYTDVGRYEEADCVQRERRRARAWKKAGMAFIEIDHQIHSFSVGGLEKSCGDDALVRSRRLGMAMMRDLGYVPHLDSVLQGSFGCDSVESTNLSTA